MQVRALAALAATAAAVLAACVAPPPSPVPPARGAGYAAPPLPSFDAAALLSDLQDFTLAYGERHDNAPTHEGARQWLEGAFASYGLDVWRQDFDAGGLRQANIVGIKWGVLRDEVVVVGAHYDTTHWDCLHDLPCAGHKTSHGAYDDGSGTLLALHLARAFSALDPFDTVAFALFDGEERGLEGARAFADAVLEGASPFGNATLRAAIDVDMWGITWPGTNAPTLVLHNSEPLYGLFDAARRAKGMPDDMVYHQDSFLSGGSDYVVFMGNDVPTLYFSSDFGQLAAPGPTVHTPGYGVYPFWHLQDTYASMLAAAGGPLALEAGFQTALDLSGAVLHAVATDPHVRLDG